MNTSWEILESSVSKVSLLSFGNVAITDYYVHLCASARQVVALCGTAVGKLNTWGDSILLEVNVSVVRICIVYFLG